jgi:hypothetical protein
MVAHCSSKQGNVSNGLYLGLIIVVPRPEP